jgi:hypothetical protein
VIWFTYSGKSGNWPQAAAFLDNRALHRRIRREAPRSPFTLAGLSRFLVPWICSYSPLEFGFENRSKLGGVAHEKRQTHGGPA